MSNLKQNKPMKVKEAIEILSKMNQESILLLTNYDENMNMNIAYRANSIYSEDEFEGEILLHRDFDCVIIK